MFKSTLATLALTMIFGISNGLKAEVHIKSAKDLHDADPYWGQGESDPYVYVYGVTNGGHQDEYRTDYVNNDNSPEWHTTIHFNERSDYIKLKFKLYDSDYNIPKISSDDQLGETKYIYLNDLDCDEWNYKSLTIYKDDDYKDIQGTLSVDIKPYECPQN
mmetsp:Transcript_58606/g.52817  ORF Transcript_58606/g.52817 Transcript_58606/m.52817 type:complete len:160 (+) Transcript_58606:121-600(+)